MASPKKPKTRRTDAGLSARAVRGPRGKEWYWQVTNPDRKTVWSGWATEQAVGPTADAAWASSHLGAGLLVGDLIARWLTARKADVAQGHLGPSTFGTYERRASVLVPGLGHLACAEITSVDLQDYLDASREAGRASRTMEAELRMLRLVWRWGMDRKLVEADLRIPRVKHQGYVNNHETPDEDDIRAVLGMLTGVERLAVEVLVTTGARVGEVSELQLEDVTPRGIRLRGKTGERFVPLPGPLASALQAHVRADPPTTDDQRVFRFVDTRSGQARIRHGRQRLQNVLESACEAAGVQAFTPHGLRRAMVRRLLRQGVDVGTAAAILGHSPVVMLRVYDEVSEDERRRAVERVAIEATAISTDNVVLGPWIRREESK